VSFSFWSVLFTQHGNTQHGTAHDLLRQRRHQLPQAPEVFESMVRFMQELGGNPGAPDTAWLPVRKRWSRVPQRGQQVLRAEESGTAGIFTLNCTDALNMAIRAWCGRAIM